MCVFCPSRPVHLRIFEQLRDEHGYGGGITIVSGYVHERRERQREMFVPLGPIRDTRKYGHRSSGESRKRDSRRSKASTASSSLHSRRSTRPWCWNRPARSVLRAAKTLSAVRNSGTDKTPVDIGLEGLGVCQKGLAVGFTTTAALVNELHEAHDGKRLLRLQRQLAGYKLLIGMNWATYRSRRLGPSCRSKSSAGATSAAPSSLPAICRSMSGPACSAPSP